MSEPIKDGGPAFPCSSLDLDVRNVGWVGGGMSLRDYFAAKALAGWIASYGAGERHPASIGANDSDSTRDQRCAQIALWSYMLADAMLKAREGK